ncbi:MAG: beta-ketoacyl-ACP synthase III [Candidatus Poribacteria bacterium]
MNRFSAIVSTGSYVPEKVLTNFDLEKMVDTSDEWIQRRTGIIERRIADKSMASSDLGIQASQKAINDAGIDPLEIDMIIAATITPDMFFPSTACFIQRAIGAQNAGAFDLSATCSGFCYGLAMADGLVKSGIYTTVLVVATDALSKVTDWKDRTTCVLFGDAAGAAIIQPTYEEKGILASYLGSRAEMELLSLPGGGSRYPSSHETVDKRMHYIRMNGQEVFKLGVRRMYESAKKVLRQAGLKVEDVDLFIPHQANIRIMEAVSERLKISSEKVYVTVHKYGNTSASTVIVALDEAIREGRVGAGDIVLFSTFGGGLTWGGTVIKL